MNNCYSNNAANPFLPSSYRVIAALGRLQTVAQQGVGGSIYIYDLIEQCTLCSSSALLSMLGYGEQELGYQWNGMEQFGLANLIHPDDLERVADHYQRFAILRSTEVIQTTYRMKHADGSWRWVRSQETPLVIASDGLPLQILGSVSLMVDSALSLSQRRRLLRSSGQRSRCRYSGRAHSPYLITPVSAKPPSSPPFRPTSS